MSINVENLELQIQSNATSATTALDALGSSLSRLRSATKGGIGLTAIAKQTDRINTSSAGAGASSANIDRLASSLEKLRNLGSIKISSTIGTQLSKLNSISSGLSGADFSGVEKLVTALEPLNSVVKPTGLQSVIRSLKELPQLSKTLSSMDWNKFIKQLQQLSKALAPLASQLNTVSTAFSKLPKNINKAVSMANKSVNSNRRMANSYMNGSFRLSAFALSAKVIADAIAGVISQSNAYIENLNLFNVAMGQYAVEAKAYAEQVGDIMGIDPGEWMRTQGIFMTITEGFGIASDRAHLMSKNLTQLTYDLSSFYNISYEDAMKKLSSGISGELEPLRRLGYDLSQAELKSIALSLGIDKTFNSMTQAEKAQLRYHAIMTQVTKTHGDMARTLDAPANMLRILQSQVSQAARAIGNIFIPTLTAVLPYAIAFVKGIRLIANALASLVGFKAFVADTSGIGTSANAMDDLADNTARAGGGMGKAAKKAKELKNALLGIDELNIISPLEDMDSGGGGGGVGGAGMFDFPLEQYKFFDESITSKADEILNKVKSMLKELQVVASGAALALGTLLIATGVNVPLGLGLVVAGAFGLADVLSTNWGSMTERLKTVLSNVMTVVGGFLFGIGLFLSLSGANLPLGVGLMLAGASGVATAAKLDWDFMDNKLNGILSILFKTLSAAALAVGAILVLSGANIPVGLGLMALGAIGLKEAVRPVWNQLPDDVKDTIKKLADGVGKLSLGLGAVLAFTGANIPLGIALMAAGAIGLVAANGINMELLTSQIKVVLEKIGTILSGALLAVGAVLAFTGVNIPLGLAMMGAGVGVLFGTFKAGGGNILADTVKELLDKVKDYWEKFTEWIKEKWEGLVGWMSPVLDLFDPSKDPRKRPLPEDQMAALFNRLDEKYKPKADPVVKAQLQLPTSNLAQQLFGNIRVIVPLEPSVDKKSKQRVEREFRDNPIEQPIALRKFHWTKVSDWVGNIPLLNQFIGLAKDRWTSVRNWIGNIPAVAQAISLSKQGWNTISEWLNPGTTTANVSLRKSGWSSISDFIGTAVEVGVKLVKQWGGTFLQFLGLQSNGGIIKAANGGYFSGGTHTQWANVPKFAGGTLNAGLHGSMFIAGEAGTEMVGHLNGQTEVLNQSQIKWAMRSAVISGMAQFVGYWRAIQSQIVIGANALIRANMLNASLVTGAINNSMSYDPTQALAQIVYEDSKTAYENTLDGESVAEAMREVYLQLIEPTLKGIASDTKRQADKDDKPVVQIGNRVINDAVSTQSKANGFRFDE